MDSSASAGTTGTEDRDRTSLALPGQEGQLISQVDAANPNTVAVMETIGPQDVTGFESSTPAILWSSYNGMRKGESLADVLLGDYNPSGRTPETWYQSVNDIPSIYSYALRPAGPNGRTYMYYTGPVSYPFGYGLSYTTFHFSHLRISKRNPTADDTINVSVDVTNTGARDGNEIVQMYVNTPHADPSLQRPIKRLEGFQKVFLSAGQTKTVTFPIKIADLAFYNEADKRFEVDQGAYGIQISTSSADSDIQAHDTINVNGKLTQKPSVLTAQPRISGVDTRERHLAAGHVPRGRRDRSGPDPRDERRLAVRVDRARPEQAAPAGDEAQLQQRPAGRRLGQPARGHPHSVQRRRDGHRDRDLPRRERIDLIRGSRRL